MLKLQFVKGSIIKNLSQTFTDQQYQIASRHTLHRLLQCDVPYRSYLIKSFLQTIPQSGCKNLIGIDVSLQSLHGCKLNNVAWVVEFMDLHIVVKCKSLLSGHSKACCTITGHYT